MCSSPILFRRRCFFPGYHQNQQCLNASTIFSKITTLLPKAFLFFFFDMIKEKVVAIILWEGQGTHFLTISTRILKFQKFDREHENRHNYRQIDFIIPSNSLTIFLDSCTKWPCFTLQNRFNFSSKKRVSKHSSGFYLWTYATWYIHSVSSNQETFYYGTPTLSIWCFIFSCFLATI